MSRCFEGNWLHFEKYVPRGTFQWFLSVFPEIFIAHGTPLQLNSVIALKKMGKAENNYTRWWFQIFFIFTPIWGNDPI